MAHAVITEKSAQATRKLAVDIQAAILASLRKRNGMAVGDGAQARWRLVRLDESAN
jgi:hypothetical protein